MGTVQAAISNNAWPGCLHATAGQRKGEQRTMLQLHETQVAAPPQEQLATWDC
jgi:hypothetical protein